MRSARRYVISLLLFVAAWPTLAESAEARARVLSNGTVVSVSARTLTVTAAGQDATFAVDAKTKLIQRNARATLLPPVKRRTFADVIGEGDRVNVVYVKRGTLKHALRITVTSTAAR